MTSDADECYYRLWKPDGTTLGEKEVTWNYLCKQKKASRCLLSLINNVLEMARIESGKEVLREARWSVQELK